MNHEPWTFKRTREFFSRLLLASVDGKQHFSEVVFSALVGFSLTTWIWFPGHTLTSRTSHQWLWCSWSRGHCGVQHVLWDFNTKLRLRCSRRFVIFLTLNPMRALNTISLKCFLPSTDAVDIRGKIHTCLRRFKVTSCKRASLKSTGFFKNKIMSNIFLIELY